MKLINYTLLFISAILFITVSLWAVLFYYQLLNQIKTTIDEGLANYKIVLIDKLKDDSPLVEQDIFIENKYTIKSVSEDYALQVRDTYKDTLIYSTIKKANYRTRLLTTAFVASDGKYYEMKVVSPEIDRGKLIKQIATSLLWLYIFLLVSIVLVNNFVLKKTWQPFYKILNNLKKFRLDKEVINLPIETKIAEFTILDETVQKLLKENVNVYSSQKQFIENASHELQTPLAICTNKLELLANGKDLSNENIHKIGNLLETLQHLSDLNKSLLLISKIENKQFISREQVSFDEIFKNILDDFSDYYKFREIEVEYELENPWLFNMNKDLAEILALNLIKNAIIHNLVGGKLSIKILSTSFIIENTSNDKALPADKLFKRFTKNANKKGSTGLGLAIAKTITEVSGLSLKYSYNGNHLFTVGLNAE